MFYTRKTIDEKFETMQQRMNSLLDEIDFIKKSLPDVARSAIAEHEQKKLAAEIKTADERQASDIPFVEIISDGYDPEQGVQLQLDWNAAFIKELASKGYKGRNERDIVNKWLTAVHAQLASEFEQADRV